MLWVGWHRHSCLCRGCTDRNVCATHPSGVDRLLLRPRGHSFARGNLMSKRVVFLALFLLCVYILTGGAVLGQAGKAPEWTHGLEMKARKADEKEFSDKTRAFGSEAYLDRTANALFYVMETGSVAAVGAAGFTAPKDIKGPKWLAAMNLSVRRAGEVKFGDATKKVGVEVFQDENPGARLYISETGSLAVLRAGPLGASAGAPKHQYGYELRVRKGPEGDFTDKTQKFGVEVFKDEAGGALIYVSETGAIAAVPAGQIAGGTELKRPTWTHGLGLPVRKAGEKDFTDATRKWGIEVFKDEKAGNLIYIAENGNLAIVPAGAFTPPVETKAPQRLRAAEVRVRRAGEGNFAEMTRKWGIEVYRDENTGNTIFITEAGALAVLTAK